MISLDTHISLPFIRNSAAHLWQWWIGEIVGALPISLRRKFSRFSDNIIICISPSEAVITCFEDQRKIDIRIQFTDGGIEPGSLSTSLDLKTSRAKVRVSDEFLLYREIELPRSARDRLRQIIALDIDRLTPLNAATAAFDAIVTRTDAVTARIQVSVGVIERNTLNAVQGICAQLGVFPDRIGIVSDDDFIARFSFPIAKQTRPACSIFDFRKIRTIDRRIIAGVAIAILIVVNVRLAFMNMDKRISQLSTELAIAKQEIVSTEKLKTQLRRTQAKARILAEAQRAPSALMTLKALTRALPDSVWLFGLDESEGHVKVSGFAPSASNLIDLLQSIPDFIQPRILAPTTKAVDGGEERFEIGFDLGSTVSK